jgi:hypothetical protein
MPVLMRRNFVPITTCDVSSGGSKEKKVTPLLISMWRIRDTQQAMRGS